MHHSLEEMQTLAIGCHLCEALLDQRKEDAAPGTAPAASSLNDKRDRVYLRVEYSKIGIIFEVLRGKNRTSPLILLSLETGSGATFDRLQLSESECNAHHSRLFCEE